MNRFSRIGLLFILVLLAQVSCSGKKGAKRPGALPANVRVYQLPQNTVWKAVINTVQYDFLLSFELLDEKRGHFSTEMVRDYQPNQKSKFRLSGTLTFDGRGIIVTLYKHQQIEVGGEWKTLGSNLSLENSILESVTKKLQSLGPLAPAKP